MNLIMHNGGVYAPILWYYCSAPMVEIMEDNAHRC